MITLYYIENISETDIPFLPNIEAWNYFMGSHRIADATGEDSFYAPRYRDTIKLSITNFNYEAHSANYLSLTLNNRTYYYFIDSIDYINEDVYAVNVHMDTIMTYWFNIKLSAYMVERRFINRWNGNDINREYIRENYSNGKYKIVENSYVDGLERDKWVVISEVNKIKFHSTSDLPAVVATMCNNWSQPTVQIFIDKDGNKIDYFASSHKQGVVLWSFARAVYDMATYDLSNEQAHYNYPSYTYTSPLDGITETIAGGTMDNPINHLADNPNLHNLFIIPFIPFSKDVTLSYPTNRRYDLTINPLYMNFGGKDKPADDPIKLRYGFVRGAYSPNTLLPVGEFEGSYAGKMTPFAPIRSVVKNATFTPIYATKNTNINVNFSVYHCPQLIDTNYIQITFGTIYANTIYPIEYSTKVTLCGKYFADCFTGKRYYYITDGTNNYYDKYNTIVCDDNILSLEMVNDPWKQYEANNRSRWATIGVGAGVNAIKDLVGIGAIAGGMGAINDTANLEKYIYSTQMSNRKKSKNNDILRARVALTETGRAEDIRSSQMGMLKSGIGILDTATAVTSQLEKESNIQHSPKSIIRGGDESSVASSSAWSIRWIKRECENLEQVAQIYHRIGYLVNEYYPSTVSLVEACNNVKTRYYYNILKLGECTVHITGRMEDEDITLDIKRRLQEGIRYWNIDVTNFELCNFTYDNVELAYL